MERLFLALPIAANLQRQLSSVSILDDPHTRRVPADQLHLTLHFIGIADAKSLIPLLTKIRVRSFELRLDHLGVFGRPANGGALWIGCPEHEDLNRLHSKLAAILRAAGIAVDQRPFVPHITLARFSPSTSRRVIDRFLAQTVPALPILRADRFSLFSSRAADHRHCYLEEAAYRLDNNTYITRR